MWDVVGTLVAGGVTLFLTARYLEEAGQLADRVAVPDGGRIVAEGTPAELKARVGEERLRLRFATEGPVHGARRALAAVGQDGLPASGDDLELRVPIPANGAAVRGVLNTLAAAGVEPTEVTTAAPDLDDVFFADTATLTGRGLKRLVRYPSMVIFLLMFVYVFGGMPGVGMACARSKYGASQARSWHLPPDGVPHQQGGALRQAATCGYSTARFWNSSTAGLTTTPSRISMARRMVSLASHPDGPSSTGRRNGISASLTSQVEEFHRYDGVWSTA